MKTIDTKSLLLGACLTALTFILTSSKTSSEESNIELYTRLSWTYVYNKQTKILYQYGCNGTQRKIDEKPECLYKVAADGSSLTMSKD